MYTISGNEVARADLPRAGYCQYCGIAGAYVELFRPESVPFEGGQITFRARVYYVCGRPHFEDSVREEARAEIHEQFAAKMPIRRVQGSAADGSPTRQDQEIPVGRAESSSEWKVTDRYCWLCGTHGAIFKSMTRCSKCGELQRLYIRDRQAGTV